MIKNSKHRYLAKADDYLSCLVGHEGRGSLLSALKAWGWASALSAGVSEGGFERNSAYYLFDVSITLTEPGLKAREGYFFSPSLLPIQPPTCWSNQISA